MTLPPHIPQTELRSPLLATNQIPWKTGARSCGVLEREGPAERLRIFLTDIAHHSPTELSHIRHLWTGEPDKRVNLRTCLKLSYDSVSVKAMVILRRLASEQLKGFHPVFKIVEFTLQIPIVYLQGKGRRVCSEEGKPRIDLMKTAKILQNQPSYVYAPWKNLRGAVNLSSAK